MSGVSDEADYWRSLHARGDTYRREEGHVTPATLSILLLLRSRTLRDQATGESASAATRQQANRVRQRGHACSDAQDGEQTLSHHNVCVCECLCVCVCVCMCVFVCVSMCLSVYSI